MDGWRKFKVEEIRFQCKKTYFEGNYSASGIRRKVSFQTPGDTSVNSQVGCRDGVLSSPQINDSDD